MAEKKEKKAKVVRKPKAKVETKLPMITEQREAQPKKLGGAKVSYYGTGRRKEAVAKVWLVPGNGKISVNSKDHAHYFCNRKLLEVKIKRPLVVSNTLDSYNVISDVLGGGVPAQADALCMGIARALLKVNPEFRKALKKEGLLRRDPRMKERKKYGLKRARKAFQFSKR